MVRMILKQLYNEKGWMDFDTVLDDREVNPEKVADTLKEYAQHPNNLEDGELIVSFGENGEMKVILYNGFYE